MKALFNGSIQGFSGRIGNLIFRQMPNGTTVVTQAPPKKTRKQKKKANLKRSARQQAHNGRFQEAAAYAKWAARENPIYAEIAAGLPLVTAYNVALSDWSHAPEIHRIERSDGHILVEASDNVLVTRVQVTILGEGGDVLEVGEAVRGEEHCWEFASQAEGKTIIAEAWDLPGQVTRLAIASIKSRS